MKKIITILILTLSSFSIHASDLDSLLAKGICDGIQNDINGFMGAIVADIEKSKFKKVSYDNVKQIYTDRAGISYNLLLSKHKKKIRSMANIKNGILKKCLIEKPKAKDLEYNQWVKKFVSAAFEGLIKK